MNLEGFSYNLQQTKIQPAKGVRRHYAGPMTSRDVIGLPPVTISLVTLYNCFLTVEDYTKDTQAIPGTEGPTTRDDFVGNSYNL